MMSKQLPTLIEAMRPLACRQSRKAEVTRLTTDSRRVIPGSVFFAVCGLRTDGNLYVEEAIDRGALAVVTDQEGGAHRDITYVRVADVRSALAAAARVFYGDPARRLNLVGITGTNGKTTVATLCQHLLEAPELPVGLIGTVRYDVGRRTFPSFKTTPESVDIYAMLDQMAEAGCRDAVMEVSSHGIDQQRVEGLKLDVAAFLNLTQDHLDYHGDMETYFEAKARLFTGDGGIPPPRVAVVNLDDPWGRRLLERVPDGCSVVTFGTSKDAEVRAEQVELSAEGTRFDLVTGAERLPIRSPLPGHFNVSNLLAGAAIFRACGRPMETLPARIEGFPGVPGRMERIDAGQPFQVLVDYAHTDDALRNAVGMLRPITPGRLLVVFGCGGNRDRAKRPLMTRAVLDTADYAYITADNPRKEALERIFEDMRAALRPADADRATFIGDRRHAIHQALASARAGDCVLIAGKGHEAFQEFSSTLIPFDDRAVARELIHLLKLAEPE